LSDRLGVGSAKFRIGIDNEYYKLCVNAREKVLKEFDSKVVAKKYIKLYNEVLNNF
jgi:glycosyltransferase involved in cell wall biosynthesis